MCYQLNFIVQKRNTASHHDEWTTTRTEYLTSQGVREFVIFSFAVLCLSATSLARTYVRDVRPSERGLRVIIITSTDWSDIWICYSLQQMVDQREFRVNKVNVFSVRPVGHPCPWTRFFLFNMDHVHNCCCSSVLPF